MIQETNKPVQNPGRQERNFSPRTRITPRSNDTVLKENLNRLRDQKAVLHRKRNSCSLTWGISSTAGCCWYIVILNAIFSQGFYFENSVWNSVVPVYTVTPVFFLDWFFRWRLHYSIAFDTILSVFDIVVQFPSRLLRDCEKLTVSGTLQSKSEQSTCKVWHVSWFVTLRVSPASG